LPSKVIAMATIARNVVRFIIYDPEASRTNTPPVETRSNPPPVR
jgi:hypothetical protein